MTVRLRRYQKQAVNKVREVRDAGAPSSVVAIPTGTGKTHLGTTWLREDYYPSDARVMWMAHTEELVHQAMKAAKKQDPAMDRRFGNLGRPGLGLVQGRNAAHHARWVYGTVQTLSKRRRLEAVLEHGIPDAVVIDECHHATATTYQDALLKTMAWYTKKKDFDWAWNKAHDVDDRRTVLEVMEHVDVPYHALGLTATAKRTDGRGLGEVFKTIASQYSLPAARHDGYLKPFVCETVLTKIPFERVKVNRQTNEFVMSDLVAVLEEDGVGNWPELVFEAWLDKTGGALQTIAFFPSIPMSAQFVELAWQRGFKAAHIGSDFCIDENGTYYPKSSMKAYRAARARIIANFRPGGITILTGFNALLEGFDSITDCILWARPTKSDIVLTQGIGRGLRTFPGVARQFRRSGGGWLIQWDSLEDAVRVMTRFQRGEDIYQDGGMYWTKFDGEPPFATSCLVLDFVDTEASLLLAGNLFGNQAKPAQVEVLEAEAAETEDLNDDESITLAEAGLRQAREEGDLSDGSGKVFKPKNLFRGARENWHDAGDQIMTAQMGYIPPVSGNYGQTTILMIYPDSPDLTADFDEKIKLWKRRRSNIKASDPQAPVKLEMADTRLKEFEAMRDLFANFSVWEVTCPVLDEGKTNAKGYPERQEQWWSSDVKARVRALIPNGVDAFEKAVLISTEYPELEGFSKKGGTGRSKRLTTDKPLYRSLTTGFVAKEARKYGVPTPSVHSVKSFTLGEASKWRSTILAHCHVRKALKEARKLREVPWVE